MSARNLVHAAARRGLTLLELVLAAGLFSMLMIGVFRLLDGSLSLWQRAEARRDLLEQSTAACELFAADLRALEGGTSGDLLVEWVRYDTDGDGAEDAHAPRVRLVRQVTPERRARLLVEAALRATGKVPPPPDPDAPFERGAPGLSQVCWVVWPEARGKEARDARSVFRILRGERLTDDATTRDFFDPEFFQRGGTWPSGALEEMSAGCLRFDLQLAAPTSLVRDGWKLGEGLGDVTASWDAWAKGRPDRQAHPWNLPHPAQIPARGQPSFPRRVRLETEFERTVDRVRRTRLVRTVLAGETAFDVGEPERVPRGDDAYLRLDAEWVKVMSVAGGTISVRRGQFGTTPAQHDQGALLHHGLHMVREIPLAVYREDWGLR